MALPVAIHKRPAPPQLIESLRKMLGERFTTNRAVCTQHGTDESFYTPQAPDAVVFPICTNEVVEVVRQCVAFSVPVIAFGVGSSIEGHVLAIHGGICIDLSLMCRVLSIRTEDLSVTVQAGVTREALNDALKDTGFFFSVDPGANATIGGMVATAASGTNTVRFGTMRDNTLSLTVVTAEGKIIRTARHARKSSAGYNLTQLFLGSEGTLGIITEITVRVHPQPECVAAAVVNFPDVDRAVRVVIVAMQMGVPLARAEMLDELTIRAINSHSRTDLKPAPTLFLEFIGSHTQVREQSLVMQNIAAEHSGGDFRWATLKEERTRLWTPRHHAYFACLQLRPGCRSVTTDACVPLSSLSQCITETVDDIQSYGLTAPVFGHVGDGNFHCLMLIDPGNERELKNSEAVSQRLMRRAIAMQGTCTGEHGVGLHKIGYLIDEHGEDTVSVMRSLKAALDPKNIMNPGKLFSL
jgi:D-lactate dehydrogenase (cytochrome)